MYHIIFFTTRPMIYSHPVLNSVGVKAGKAAGMKVVAVPSLHNESDSYSIADSILHSLLELRTEEWGLPQFEDCMSRVHLPPLF